MASSCHHPHREGMTKPNPAISGAVGTAVAAIGALPDVGGFALAGVLVYLADTAERVADAWEALPTRWASSSLARAAADGLGEESVARIVPSHGGDAAMTGQRLGKPRLNRCEPRSSPVPARMRT